MVDARRAKGILALSNNFAFSGIPINKSEMVNKYFKDFDEMIGLKHLVVVHLNDSKVPLNARVDRHENLTQGYIFGEEKGGDIKALRTLLVFLTKYKIPALLETPGDDSERAEEAGSYQYQIEMIKNLVSEYRKLPQPSINLMSSEEKYFFEEHIRDFLNEKWEIAIQFPDDKILINQI